MLFVTLAYAVPLLVVIVSLALLTRRATWSARSLRQKFSAAILLVAGGTTLSALIHIVAAMVSKCSAPDCAMGYVLGGVLLLPVGLILLTSGLLLRLKPIYAAAGHLLLVPVVIDFVLFATRPGYESYILWGG
jgi:Ca2+/Na+ antiporter